MPILGNKNVGKSTLFNIFRGITDKRFSYKTAEFVLIENVRYKNFAFNIQLWDSFGANNIKKIIKDIYKEATIGIILYDVSDMSKISYEDVKKWANELWKNNDDRKIPVLILGNKIDLRGARIPTLELNDCREVPKELSGECGIPIPQLEISALSKENCEKLIDLILDLTIQSFNKSN